MVNVEGDHYILDIYCQQLWNVVQLGGVCVPFGHRVGECTFSKICICIGYILPTIVECCSVKGVSVCPLGTGLENVHSTVSGVVNVGGGERHILRGGW